MSKYAVKLVIKGNIKELIKVLNDSGLEVLDAKWEEEIDEKLLQEL